MLGNAPTRMVFALPCADDETAVASHKNPTSDRLLTLTSNHHGKEVGGFFLQLLAMFPMLAGWQTLIDDQVGEGRVVENTCRRVAYVREHLV